MRQHASATMASQPGATAATNFATNSLISFYLGTMSPANLLGTGSTPDNNGTGSGTVNGTGVITLTIFPTATAGVTDVWAMDDRSLYPVAAPITIALPPTATPTPVDTATNTPVDTATNTPVDTATPTADTATDTPADTATATDTPTNTATPVSNPPNWVTLAATPATGALFQAAAVGSDGSLYYFGGLAGGATAGNMNYQPGEGTWAQPQTSLPVNLAQAAAATTASGEVLIAGGTSQVDGSDVQPWVWVYYPITDAYASGAPMPTARRGLGLVAGEDGLIYAIGGASPFTTTLGANTVYDTVEVYDPDADTWTAGPPLNTARAFFATAVGPDGRIYVIGGSDASGQALSSVEAYVPGGDTWTYVASLPSALCDLAATTGADGRIYASGGSVGGDGTDMAGSCLDVAPADRELAVYAYSYNQGDDGHWDAVAPLNDARAGQTMVTGSDGRMFVEGGTDADGDALPVEAYGPDLQFTPTSASPGDTVTITGTGFVPGALVRVYWGPVQQDIVMTQTLADDAGDVAGVTITVPDDAPSGTVRVSDGGRREPLPGRRRGAARRGGRRASSGLGAGPGAGGLPPPRLGGLDRERGPG